MQAVRGRAWAGGGGRLGVCGHVWARACPWAMTAPPVSSLSWAMIGAMASPMALTEGRHDSRELSSAAPLERARADEPAYVCDCEGATEGARVEGCMGGGGGGGVGGGHLEGGAAVILQLARAFEEHGAGEKMAGAPTNRLAEGDDVWLQVPALGEEAPGAPRGRGYAVAAEAAHDLVGDHGDPARLGLGDVGLEEGRGPRHRGDGGAPLRLDQQHPQLVLVHVEVALELAEDASVEGRLVLAAPPEERARHRVADGVGEALGAGAERRCAARRGRGRAVVRGRAARHARPRVRPREVHAPHCLCDLQPHVDGGVDGAGALGLQVHAPVVTRERQVRNQGVEKRVHRPRHARRRVDRQHLCRLVAAQRLHRPHLELEAVTQQVGEVGATQYLRARAAEHANLARACAREVEASLLLRHWQVLADRVAAREAGVLVAHRWLLHGRDGHRRWAASPVKRPSRPQHRGRVENDEHAHVKISRGWIQGI